MKKKKNEFSYFIFSSWITLRKIKCLVRVLTCVRTSAISFVARRKGPIQLCRTLAMLTVNTTYVQKLKFPDRYTSNCEFYCVYTVLDKESRMDL